MPGMPNFNFILKHRDTFTKQELNNFKKKFNEAKTLNEQRGVLFKIILADIKK